MRTKNKPFSPSQRVKTPTKPAPQKSPRVSRENILYGFHPVAAAWQNPQRQCLRLLVTEAGRDAMAAILRSADRLGLSRPSFTLTDKSELDRLLPGAVHQGIVLETVPLEEPSLEDVCEAVQGRDKSLILVLDQVTDPHNVGAILRSACAFGAVAVMMTDRHSPEATATLAKAACGALEHVPLVRVVNLARSLNLLQKAGFWCVGLAESGDRTLADVDASGHMALVLGAEGTGLRRLTLDNCDEVVRLPTSGPVASLNVSNAAAVALYDIARRR